MARIAEDMVHVGSGLGPNWIRVLVQPTLGPIWDQIVHNAGPIWQHSSTSQYARSPGNIEADTMENYC